MLFATILLLHIAAAIVTGMVSLGALYIAVSSKFEWYRSTALFLAGIAAFEVVTGTILIGLTPNISSAYLQGHIALYLSYCLTVEVLLYIWKASRSFTLTAQ
jgi:hypothetical protein